jgi:hypothetical protein
MRTLRAFFQTMASIRYRRAIECALALNRRGEARSDGLVASRVISRLEVEWLARDIHPWDQDRDLSSEERGNLFVEQCLSDTYAATSRLFDSLSQLDTIDIRVLDPESKTTIITGRICRADLENLDHLSVGMRLRLSGATFRLSGWNFDPLDPPGDQDSGVQANTQWDLEAATARLWQHR